MTRRLYQLLCRVAEWIDKKTAVLLWMGFTIAVMGLATYAHFVDKHPGHAEFMIAVTLSGMAAIFILISQWFEMQSTRETERIYRELLDHLYGAKRDKK